MDIAGTSANYSDLISQIQESQKKEASTKADEAKSGNKNSMLGKDDFLKLLVTSLTYQDPSSPMETSDMMQQMAMLGLMEQTTNMRTALDDLSKSNELSKWQQVSGMVDKTIEGTNTEGKEASGKVKEVINYNGEMYLLTDDDAFKVGDISSLKQTNVTSENKEKASTNSLDEEEYAVNDLNNL